MGKGGTAVVPPLRPTGWMDGRMWSSILRARERNGLPVVVDALAHAVMKDGAASDMLGNMQSPVIRTEEQL